MMIQPFDQRRDIVILEDATEAVTFAVEHFIKCAHEAIDLKGHFFVALSGGSTPKLIYQMLSSSKYKDRIDWSRCYLFWSDERAVSKEDSESNYKMAMEAGLSKLNIPESHIFRMKGEGEIDLHALEYEKTIERVLKGAPFDLVMLGMGEDGHTASLFPGTEALFVEDRMVVANHVPQKNTYRLTFTFPLINSARHIAIYVMGPSKSLPVKKVFLDPHPSYPISKIGTKSHNALWILDREAARVLTSLWKPLS